MSRDRRRTPRLESLEGKQLLSTAHPAAAAPKPAAAHAAPLVLDGLMAASAYAVPLRTGAIDQAVITLAGNAGAMGPVKATLTEFIDVSTESVRRANLVITDARGSVTLTLSKFSVFENLTTDYNEGYSADYVVTSGTGSFAGATGGAGAIRVKPDITDPDLHVALHTTS